MSAGPSGARPAGCAASHAQINFWREKEAPEVVERWRVEVGGAGRMLELQL